MKKFLFYLIFLLYVQQESFVVEAAVGSDGLSSFNISKDSNKTVCNTEASECREGLILPVWLPLKNIGIGTTIARALIYGFSLGYLFLGVSIISDRFMSAIEVITSQEREIHVTDSDGNKQTVMVRYWNETVSNLTVS
jgi:solute carrier family 8 (sodium/calcium exchanger)